MIRLIKHASSLFFSLLMALVALTPQLKSQEPSWAADAIWYQIFPERFRNGDPTNDPTAHDVRLATDPEWHVSPWTSDWYKMQPWEMARSDKFYRVVFDRRYGGDLQGVMDKLDYLSRLGITAIYFNPLFESISLHKYDASSYHHIDRTFGPDPKGDERLVAAETDDPRTWHWTAADSLFLAVVKQAHARKIRVIIDGVFNHCGTEFFAFRDVVENQKRSRYADWFDVRRWDDDRTPHSEFVYKGWWDHASMPEFKEDANGFVPPVRAYFTNVTKRWMDPNGDGDPSDGVDGWRLDVANDVSHVFWREWRILVKSLNPNAYIVGEIWDNAKEWLQGDEFDAVMNYRFARACMRFFVDTNSGRYTCSDFDKELAAIRADYPEHTNEVLQNLLESHDTDRLPSQIMNPNREFDRNNGLRDNPRYDYQAPTEAARQLQKLIVLFQMTYVGAPMVYYGSESGMWGADDPDDRKPMVWKDLTYEVERAEPGQAAESKRQKVDSVRFDEEMFAWYQKLIAIRNGSEALRRGTMRALLADDEKNVFVFERKHADETILVVINNAETTQEIRVEGSFVNLLDETSVDGTIQLRRKSGAILQPAR